MRVKEATQSTERHPNEENPLLDKGKPVARRGRKARGLPREVAQLPKGESNMTFSAVASKPARIVCGALLATYYVATLGVLPASASSRDADGDGMPTRWEVAHNLNAHRANANRDPDHDRLSNLGEYRHDVSPHDEDSDNDGMDDGDEIRDDRTSTEVDDADTNDDGDLDGDEDADHDGIDNEDEDDAKEPCVADDDDSDSDGIDNEDENDFGTRIHDADSDDDGIEDGDEDVDSDNVDNEDQDDSQDRRDECEIEDEDQGDNV